MSLIHSLKADELDALVHMCARAFSKDDGVLACLGGNWSLATDFFSAMTRATLLEGQIYAVKDHDRIVSVGFWFEPGTFLWTTEEQRAVGFNDFFNKLSPEAQNWWTDTYPEAVRLHGEVLFTEEERTRRWWCSNLATDPGYEGRGYATAIVNAVYDKAVKTRTFIALATGTDTNVQKYLSMGFRQRGGFHIPTVVDLALDVRVLIRE